MQGKSAQADAHGAGDVQHVAVAGHAAGLAGNVGQRVGGHMAVDHGDGHAVVLVRHETGSVGAELGGQHAVIGAGAAAALHVAGHADAGLGTGHLLDLLRNAGCGGGVTGLGALGGPLLALHLGLLGGEGTLGHGQNREVLARLGAVLDSSGDLLDVVGQLRQQDDVRAARNAGVQRQPAGFVAHDLNAHDAAVAARGGVDAVNDLGGDVHSSVEAERHVGAVDVVVDGFGQTDDVQALLAEQVCGFVGAVAAQAEQAVQFGGAVVFLHRGNLVHLVLLDHTHFFERGALGAQNGAAHGQNAGELVRGHLPEVAVDQAVVAVHDADDLDLIAHAVVQRLGHAAQGSVQAGAVAAGSQDTNTNRHCKNLPLLTYSTIYKCTLTAKGCQV